MRWSRFRIRTLMVAVAVVGLSSAAITQLQIGHVEYGTLDPRYWDDSWFPPAPTRPWPPDVLERLRAMGIDVEPMPNGADAFAK